MLFAPLLLAGLVSAKFVFTDIAVYGINRCFTEGLAPSTRKIVLRAPFRAGLDNPEERGWASVEFDDQDNIVFGAAKSGASGFLKHATIMTGEEVDEHIHDNVASQVEPGDFVMAIIKHSPNLKLGGLDYDSVFHGHGDDMEEVVRLFVDKYGDQGSFTLVTALVKDAEAGHEHYFSLIPDHA